MFTTIDEVAELTGQTVTQNIIIAAQAMIESYVGRVEAEVNDAQDTQHLGRAVAYQAAYIGDEDGLSRIMSQMKISYILEFGNSVSFVDDGYSPWIAPLAAISCRRLTWTRARSIKTGRLFSQPAGESRWAYE